MKELKSETPPLQLDYAATAAALLMPQSTLENECRHGRGPIFFTVGRRKYTTPALIREWQAEKIADAKKNRIAE